MIASIICTALSIRKLTDPLTISPALWGTLEETVATVVANAPILRILVFGGTKFASGSHSNRAKNGCPRERLIHDYEMGGDLTIVSAKPKAIPAEDALVVVRMVEVT